MSKTDPVTIDGWLRRLDWSLHRLTSNDRNEIARELRSHFQERIEQGLSEAQILASLGLPEDYARDFLEDFELSQALGSRTLPRMMAAAAQRIHRSLAAAAAFTSVLLLAVFAASVVLTAIMHFVDPAHWGLWISNRMFLIGQIDDPREARELLGVGIYPVAAICVTACLSLGRLSLLAALRRIVRHH